MIRAILVGLMALLTAPAFAGSRVTVEQLNREISSSHEKLDAKVADHLSGLELTERLSAARLAVMEKALPGPESRRALVLLADQATFLNPPAAEIPNQPAPSFEQQRTMIAKTVDYVAAMTHRLPNLFAQRDTIHFEDTPPGLKLGTSHSFNAAQPLHPVSRTPVTVLYRDGQDFIRIDGKEQPATTLTTSGLSSFGEFGSILSTVLIDLPKGKLAWSHWELGLSKPVAVFSFAVPKAASHYAVRFCCVGRIPFQQYSGYHGELTIEPESGTILRLTLLADLAKDDPMTEAELSVEYGPIELGGKIYFCPKRGVSLSRAADQATFRGAKIDSSYGMGTVVAPEDLSEVPQQTMLNETVFDNYHLFQSDARILTGGNSEPAFTPAAAASAPSVSAESSKSNSGAQPQLAGENPLRPATTAGNVARVDERAPAVQKSAVPPPIAATPVARATPEMSVTPQQTPSIPDAAPNEAKFSLRVTTRIVEVSLAAFDKKGRPVTGLKREDFEIFDSGKKQTLNSFGPAEDATAAIPATAPTSEPTTEYTNRADAVTGPAGKVPAESSTIIFFDVTSLQFNDLTSARQQVLKILGSLPPSEPVGLYVRIGFGFRVLLEGTIDRTALTATLNDWKPNARDIARAQEAEARNRQQFDTLASPKAVDSTYAVVGGSGGGPTVGLDPKLLNLGEEPTREALSVLIAVATTWEPSPGTKTLSGLPAITCLRTGVISQPAVTRVAWAPTALPHIASTHRKPSTTRM